MMGSAAFRAVLLSIKIQRNFNIYEGDSDQLVGILRSRHFFRHQDRPYQVMSYALYDIKCHLMTIDNDAYDIKLGQQSSWPILLSKEASGPQK